MDKLFLSWDDIHSFVSKIHEQTQLLDKDSAIIGLSRGGLIPAVLLAHLKGVDTFYAAGIKSYNGQEKSGEIMFQYPDKHMLSKKNTVYVVDDICDTGGTLQFIQNYMLPINIVSITLVYRVNEIYRPNYSGVDLFDKRWVVFPWEKTK